MTDALIRLLQRLRLYGRAVSHEPLAGPRIREPRGGGEREQNGRQDRRGGAGTNVWQADLLFRRRGEDRMPRAFPRPLGACLRCYPDVLKKRFRYPNCVFALRSVSSEIWFWMMSR